MAKKKKDAGLLQSLSNWSNERKQRKTDPWSRVS